MDAEHSLPGSFPPFDLGSDLQFLHEIPNILSPQLPSNAQRTPLDPAKCYAALVSRSRAADGTFVYGVKSTKIYCRSVCPARKAQRANVVFFHTAREAEASGFRACKRCRPETEGQMPEGEMVGRVRRFASSHGKVESRETARSEGTEKGKQKANDAAGESESENMTLEEMAKKAGVSKWHFWRTFKQVTGRTPGQYLSIQNHSQPTQKNVMNSEISAMQETDFSWEDMDFGLDRETLQSIEAQMHEIGNWSDLGTWVDETLPWYNTDHDSGFVK